MQRELLRRLPLLKLLEKLRKPLLKHRDKLNLLLHKLKKKERKLKQLKLKERH
jgi:hypothetical protein